jgi:chromosome segregation ATPase
MKVVDDHGEGVEVFEEKKDNEQAVAYPHEKDVSFPDHNKATDTTLLTAIEQTLTSTSTILDDDPSTTTSDHDQVFASLASAATFDVSYDDFCQHLETAKARAAEVPTMLSTLQERVATLLQENHEKDQLYNAQQAEMARLKCETHKLSEVYGLLYQQAADKATEAAARATQCQEQLAEGEASLRALASTLQQRTDERNTSQARLDGKDEEINEWKHTVDSLRAELAQQRSALDHRDMQVQQLASEKLLLQKDADTQVRSLTGAVQEHRTQATDLVREKAQLTHALQSLQGERDALEEERNQYRASSATQTTRIDALRGEIEETKRLNEALTSHKQTVHQANINLASEKLVLESQHEALRDEMDRHATEMQQLQEAVRGLRIQVHDLRQEASSLQEENRGLVAANDEAQKTAATVLEENNKIKARDQRRREVFAKKRP